MSLRLFDHIDLRVHNLAEVRGLYDAFLPAMGFGNIKADELSVMYSATGADGVGKPPFIGIDEMPEHRGNATRIAFWADSEEEVDRIGEIVRAAGARVVEGPEYCFEYAPGYYAVFFEDACGNKWEVCFRNARIRSDEEKEEAVAPAIASPS